MHFLCAVVLWLLALHSAAAEPTWTSLKTKAGISLSYRYNTSFDNKRLEVKASAFYPGKAESFLLLLKDTKSVQRWLKQSEDARLLDGSTESHWKVYTRFQSVWPVSPRDMVTCANVIRKENKLVVQINDCSELVPEAKNYVRIRDIKAVWTLTTRDQGFDMQYQGGANPGGELPKWLVKQLTLSSLRASFVAFKTELKRPAYQIKSTQATR